MRSSCWDLVEQLLHKSTDDHTLLLRKLILRSTFRIGTRCGEIAKSVDHVHKSHHLNQNLIVNLVSFFTNGVTLSGVKRPLVLGINYWEVRLLEKSGHFTLLRGEMLMRHMPISDLTSELVQAILHRFSALTSNLSLEELPIYEFTRESQSTFEIVFKHLVCLSFNAHTLKRSAEVLLSSTTVMLALLCLILGLFELELKHLDLLLQL